MVRLPGSSSSTSTTSAGFQVDRRQPDAVEQHARGGHRHRHDVGLQSVRGPLDVGNLQELPSRANGRALTPFVDGDVRPGLARIVRVSDAGSPSFRHSPRESTPSGKIANSEIDTNAPRFAREISTPI